ncbi:MAG: glycosyltransferase [Prevotella sp.]|nr:glycosyltransferase [Prevotella sp.]
MISVCMTSYDGERYIKEQIDSILMQLGEDDELVISDDGSTDKTLDIISSFNDPRIRVLHHDSKTVRTPFLLDKPTHNFEYALRHSQGDIIFLSDQDDVWEPGKVTMMLKALEHADLAVHDCKVVDSTMDTVVEPSYFRYIGVHQGVWNNLLKATYLGCCMAFRRRVLMEALPFPETKVGHDLWLGIVADMKYKTALVDRPLIRYRKHKDSRTTSGRRSRHSIWFKMNYRLAVLANIIKLYIR